MRYFVCLLDRDGRGISARARRAYEALPQARGLEFAWQNFGHTAVLTAWNDSWGDPLIAKERHWIAVGVVRLDNREDAECWAGAVGTQLTDLELVLRLVARTGTKHIQDILGDFAFVIRDGTTRTTVAAVDALGVKKLFYAERHGLVAFASRAEALALEERYETQYLAELIANCVPSAGLTVYAGVGKVPAGTIAALGHGELTLRTYWAPDWCESEPFRPQLEREAPATLRHLLCESVRRRVSHNGGTWAHLSGGLDSSSIVSVTQWLAEHGVISHGLAGTVTHVDWQGTDADEREYAGAVAARWGVRNEAIVDPPIWLDEDAPPNLDQPRDSIAFYPRDRKLCSIVRSAGGHVLLAGFGSDELFTGTTLFFADWVAQGRLCAVVREMTRWAAMGRVSFWRLAYANAFRPLLPGFRAPKSFAQGRLLPWVAPAAARRYGLGSRVSARAVNAGRLGHKHRHALVGNVNVIATTLDAAATGDSLDVRYPFLSRPLVEFALRLPSELSARPQARKWVLREAMRGILPEVVRTRIGKGGSTDLIVRSLTAQRSLLEPLVRDPILADLGIIDAEKLRTAFETAPLEVRADYDLCVDVHNTLTTEAWLRIRSGRWPQGAPS